jgi:hypothetical protein
LTRKREVYDQIFTHQYDCNGLTNHVLLGRQEAEKTLLVDKLAQLTKINKELMEKNT